MAMRPLIILLMHLGLVLVIMAGDDEVEHRDGANNNSSNTARIRHRSKVDGAIKIVDTEHGENGTVGNNNSSNSRISNNRVEIPGRCIIGNNGVIIAIII